MALVSRDPIILTLRKEQRKDSAISKVIAISENMIIKERRRILKEAHVQFYPPRFIPEDKLSPERERGLRIKCATSSSPRLIYASGLLIRKINFSLRLKAPV